MTAACPACAGSLIPVESYGHYGAGITVETCLECHGFWTDAQEERALAGEAVATLEGDVDLAQISTQPRAQQRRCPWCTLALQEISGGALPEGLHVDVCPQCEGMWFDRGELRVYKSALELDRQRQRQSQMAETRVAERELRFKRQVLDAEQRLRRTALRRGRLLAGLL